MPDKIQFYTKSPVPLETHKVTTVQKLNLLPVEARLRAIKEGGFNTFLLRSGDVFLDMLTDSGVNAMSDRQQSAMMVADDSYAGSETFFRLAATIEDIFGKKYFLPAHQGRACENIIAQHFVTAGSVVPMNYHFTTTRAHITINGGSIAELVLDEGMISQSDYPFKGNMDIEKLEAFIESLGPERIPFVRMEAGANLIGGQPFSLENLRQVRDVCERFAVPIVLDASLLQDNLYFIKERETRCRDMGTGEILRAISDLCDVIYFSGRKLGCARGGGICTNDPQIYREMRELVPLYEGFLTYGGMSVREMEAMRVGLEEVLDEEVIAQGPQFIRHMALELQELGIPVVTPPGGLGCHIDAAQFVDHLPQTQYPAGALAAAVYLASGVRGMERGTLAEDRDSSGKETPAAMELLRLALPRRVFTLSQIEYATDRIAWLYQKRHLIGGLRFTEEPRVLRFFFGRLEALTDWPEKLVAEFKKDFGESL